MATSLCTVDRLSERRRRRLCPRARARVGSDCERINPGDKAYRFETITKVVSGRDERTLQIVSDVYGSVVRAGVRRAPSTKPALAGCKDNFVRICDELVMIINALG